jgi:hypothetical protein
MELSWSDPRPSEDEPRFDNAASPYAHYFLTAPAVARDDSPRIQRRRSTVDLSTRLNRSVDELISRAFES